MRVIILGLCFFIAFLNNANAGVMYNCIDRDGNSIFTDTPQDGMKCDLKESSINTSPRQQEEIESTIKQETNESPRRKQRKHQRIVRDHDSFQRHERRPVLPVETKREIVTNASAENLDGTWIFDAEATADYVVRSPQYHGAHEAAEFFGLAGPFACAMMYEFNGDTATVRPLGTTGSKMATELRLLSRQGREIQYIVNEDATKTKDSKPSILTVVVSSSKNIKIVQSRQEDMDFLLWKRITSDQKLDSRALLESWMPFIEKIMNVLNAKTNHENVGERKRRHQ